MDKDTKDILEAVNFIKDHMVTKTDFEDAVEKLDGRLTAVESKIGGIHNRIDDEALKRENLENRVRSTFPIFRHRRSTCSPLRPAHMTGR